MVKSLTNPLRSRPAPLGTLLSAAGRRLAADLDDALAAAGFGDIRATHTPLFMVVDPEGSTATEMAQRAHMTKQSMGDLVRYLAETGYVSISPSDTDRRARVVHLTNQGWQAMTAGLAVIAEFDAWLANEIGEPQVELVRDVLYTIIAADWKQDASHRTKATSSVD